jgi:hypothetical protein
VIQSLACKATVAREPIWRPIKGAFVIVNAGWGQSVRAQIMIAPPGPGVVQFAVRFASWQAPPWTWLNLDSLGVIFTPEAA